MYILGNGRIITQDKKNPYIRNGGVVIENDLIVEVGKTETLLEKYPEVEFIDVENKIIMPGLINTHMHIYSSFARGLSLDGENKNFNDILENVWWRLDKKLLKEDIKYSAYATYIESIKNGVTTVIDHHASPYCIEGSLKLIGDVAEEIGIRTSLCYEVSDRDGEIIANEGIKENINFIKYTEIRNTDMLKGMFGLHASFTLSDETLEKCKRAMRDLKAGYHIHVAEGYSDLTDSLSRCGKRVIERLDEYGIFRENTLAIHCIHVNSRELDIIKESKCNIVHNPESNMGNSVGCSPVIQMFKKNIVVGLGTDGYTADMLESLKVANILQKHHLCDPTSGWEESIAMLFKNNREIVKKQFGCEVGILKAGSKADIIVVDYEPHTEINEKNYNGHIVFGMSGRSVDTTICNGKIIMKDRKILTIKEKEILKKSRQESKKLWNRI